MPRAELTALKHTHGSVAVAIDAKHLTGFAKGPKRIHSSNLDLWEELWQVQEDRQGKVQIHWTPSHVGLQELQDGVVATWAFTMNHIADRLAEAAAESHQLPRSTVSSIEWIDRRVRQVQSRLVAVFHPML